MTEGKITEYIEQRKIVLSVCMKDRGSRLQLLTLSNHEVSISPKRALLISSASLDISKPRGDLLKELKDVDEARSDYMKTVSVKDLWELVHEEKETFTYEYLAQLTFGKNVTDDHISALVRALFADKVFFKMRDDYFIPNSANTVEQIRKAREIAELREREITEGAMWLKGVMANRHPDDPPLKKNIVRVLVQLALYGNDAEDFKLGKEMFTRAGIKQIDQARHLLVKLNIWDKDENLDLHRTKRSINFSRPVLKEADALVGKEIETSGREDLTHLSIFTIDGPFTKDFDDALSLETIEGGYRLGIHVTDVAPFIPVDSPLDREALCRASSVYLPANQIPMLPLSLSNNALSLTQGCDRLALSLLTEFDSNCNLKTHRFTPTIVRVHEQLTYDQVDSVYGDEPHFLALHAISQALREKRVEAGALLIPLPELQLEVGNNQDVRAKLSEQDTPARIMVSECMILYNNLAAKFAAERALPILYRCQESPQERVLVDKTNYIFYVFQQRRKLHPLLINTVPKPHSGVGVDVYTNATSPLRRYMDLLAQRQIHSALFNREPVYTESQLKDLHIALQQALREVGLMRRNQIRYWLLKYLTTKTNDVFDAIVFQKLRYKYLVILTDFLFVADVPKVSGHELLPGQRIKVVVKKSDPWNDNLTLALA